MPSYHIRLEIKEYIMFMMEFDYMKVVHAHGRKDNNW